MSDYNEAYAEALSCGCHRCGASMQDVAYKASEDAGRIVAERIKARAVKMGIDPKKIVVSCCQ